MNFVLLLLLLFYYYFIITKKLDEIDEVDWSLRRLSQLTC